MGVYSRYILPRVLDAVCAMKDVAERRAKVLGFAHGVVLEPGIGGGLNLPFYAANRVSKVIGVDPSVELGRKARARSAKVPFAVELLTQSAELDAVEPESVDTVVLTYTLCSIPDPARALAAARRALKPDGILLFCEHAGAPDPGVSAWQRRIEPFWKPLAGGCHLTRDAAQSIRDAGFDIQALDESYAEGSPRFSGFHQMGRAAKASERTSKP